MTVSTNAKTWENSQYFSNNLKTFYSLLQLRLTNNNNSKKVKLMHVDGINNSKSSFIIIWRTILLLKKFVSWFLIFNRLVWIWDSVCLSCCLFKLLWLHSLYRTVRQLLYPEISVLHWCVGSPHELKKSHSV